MSKAPKAKKAAKAKTPPPEAPAREARSGGIKRMIGLAGFVLAAVAVAYAFKPLWSPVIAPYFSGFESPTPDTPDTPAAEAAAGTAPEDTASLQEMQSERRQMRDDLNRLMARMESIENSVEEAKKMIRVTARPRDENGAEDGGENNPGPSLAALSERLNELEKGGDALNSLVQRLDQMEKSGALQSSGESGGGWAKALVLAVANLRQAIAKDAPYGGALESLEAVSADDPDIKTAALLLAKTADTGIPTLATLRDRFDGLAGKIVHASKALEENGWMERAANRITALVTLRRIDGHEEGTSVDAIVARAEARLKEGNLPAAVKALKDLSGFEKANARAAPWLRDAKARVTAERAVATLHVYAISLLSPAKE